MPSNHQAFTSIRASLKQFLTARAAVISLVLATVVTAAWLLAPAADTVAQTKLGSRPRGGTPTQACADPIAFVSGQVGTARPGVVTATDALFVLRAAVALVSCDLCVCDINGSGNITAADALGTLASATGQPISLDCPPCGMTSTTSTTCPVASPPESGLNFGVTESSSGVAGSDVAAEAAVSEHPADLFTSSVSGAHSPGAAGDNTLSLEDSGLGLATNDELDAVSFGDYVAGPYDYHFSLRDSGRVMGVEGTDVRDQYDTEVVPGDIYSSLGQPAGAAGTNLLTADEIALGLQPHDLSSDPTDDLDALDFSPPVVGPYYFSVSGNGSGGADVFRSIGGTATQILAAADLGLLDSDEIDALVVQDRNDNDIFDDGDYLLFSVSLGSIGAPGSAVREQARLGEASADIFVSTGDGSHALAVDETNLGLREVDDIDALEIRRSGAAACGCGDGVLTAPEQCEVGIPCANGAICDLANCTCPLGFCEDGILTPPEQCEFPNPVCPAGQFCDPRDCKCYKFKGCGDGNIDPGEACDPAAAPTGCPAMQICNLDCTCDPDPHCGNGKLDPGEQCDPPAGTCPVGEVCNASCDCVPSDGFECPNGVLEGLEECERGIDCADDTLFCNVETCTCTEFPCDPNGVVDPGEICDPLADPNGCRDGEACIDGCVCRLYTARCGDGAYTPGVEDCDFVTIGMDTAAVGCAEGQLCDPETCMCLSCIEPDPKSVEVIIYQGHAIPTCQLNFAGPDQCPEDHWHGAGYGIPAGPTGFLGANGEVGAGLTFFIDPNPPTGCGFGTITELPRTDFPIGGAEACAFRDANVPCIQ